MKLNPIKANMTELEINGMRVLFSYKTPVASFNAKTGEHHKTSKKWSVTTSRHINQWLDGNIAYEMPQEFFDNLLKKVK